MPHLKKKFKLIFIFKGTRRSVASISPRRSEFDPQLMWLRFFVNDLAVGQFSFFPNISISLYLYPSITSVCTVRSSFSFYFFWKDNRANSAKHYYYYYYYYYYCNHWTEKHLLIFTGARLLNPQFHCLYFSDIEPYEKSPFYFNRLLIEVTFFD